jgi:hypothetical protein
MCCDLTRLRSLPEVIESKPHPKYEIYITLAGSTFSVIGIGEKVDGDRDVGDRVSHHHQS